MNYTKQPVSLLVRNKKMAIVPSKTNYNDQKGKNTVKNII